MPQCTQCLCWGHSRVSCQTNFSYCTVCSRRHMTSDHQNILLRGKKPKYDLMCINCLAAGMTHTHKATDHLCPFFVRQNNKKNITSLLEMICLHQLDGFRNPFGLTKVRHQTSGSSSYESSSASCKHQSRTGNYPTQFLTNAAVVSSQGSGSSFQLANSDDSLFRNVPNTSASQVARASIVYIQDAIYSS